MLLKRLPRLITQALVDTINHDGIEHAGYLSFLSMLALFPFLVFLVALAGFFGQSEAGAAFVTLMLNYMPNDVTAAISPRLQEIVSGPPPGLLTVSIIGAVWTASSAVEGIRTVLNRAYRVSNPPAYAWRRTLSILQFLLLTIMILIGMFLLVLAPVIWNRVEHWLPVDLHIDPIWTTVRYVVSAFLLLLVVESLYYVLPNIRQRWRTSLPGAALVVTLWMVTAVLMSIYLRDFQQVNFIYGSLAGIIAALLFFYLMNLIFIFGAEFNYQLEKELGHRIEPKE
ncbi:MAG: YihY/virulence factor BrkB family protein [Alphaproteobacteria bacterium]|nr:YihY/virulence factor BrkB family protein [Alphaproteobacteria bacterium]